MNGPHMDEARPGGAPWRWLLLSLAPGLSSDLLFSMVYLGSSGGERSLTPWTAGLLLGALGLPLLSPFYLAAVGRRYVERRHAGFQSAVPFVVLSGLANVVLWLAGFSLVLFSINHV